MTFNFLTSLFAIIVNLHSTILDNVTRKYLLNLLLYALAGVAQWIELWPANQRVAGLIPSQGTWPGCGPGPQ